MRPRTLTYIIAATVLVGQIQWFHKLRETQNLPATVHDRFIAVKKNRLKDGVSMGVSEKAVLANCSGGHGCEASRTVVPNYSNATVTTDSAKVVTFSLHVILTKLISSKLLLEDLRRADYKPHTSHVKLVVHIDNITTRETIEFATHWRWPYGKKIIKGRSGSMGWEKMLLEAWDNPTDEDFFIVFEDGLRVSRVFFQWTLKLSAFYWPSDLRRRDPQVFGFSLCSMQHDYMSEPTRVWRSHDYVNNKFKVYLHAVAPVCGAVYIGSRWNQFLKFIEVRERAMGQSRKQVEDALAIEDRNLHIPNSVSNAWAQTWRRYLVEFIFGRGYLTVFPNIPETTALAFYSESAFEPANSSGNGTQLPSLVENRKFVPLNLPALRALPVVDMHCRTSSRMDLLRGGDTFLTRVHSLGAAYASLVDAWRRPCLLDELAEERTAQETAACDGWFLIYGPQMGLNNQLLALAFGMLWARVLERTLVVPHLFWPRATNVSDQAREGWVEHGEIFDAEALAEAFNGLRVMHGSVTNLRALSWPTRILRTRRQPRLDQLQGAYLRIALGDSMETVADESRPQSVQVREVLSPYEGFDETRIRSALGTCQDAVLAIDNLFYLQPMDSGPPAVERAWRHATRPNKRTARIAAAMVQSVRSASPSSQYTCLHLRLGDFARFCADGGGPAPLANYQAGEGQATAMLSSGGHGDAVSGGMDACLVTREMVLNAIGPSDGTRAILTVTDDAPAARRLLRGLASPVFTSEDVAAAVAAAIPTPAGTARPGLLGALSTVVDQITCAAADDIWVNRYSTMSQGIVWNRRQGRRGVHYWKVLPVEGSGGISTPQRKD